MMFNDSVEAFMLRLKRNPVPDDSSSWNSIIRETQKVVPRQFRKEHKRGDKTMGIDFKTMEEKAKEQREERDRKFSEGMKRMQDSILEQQNETMVLWEKSVRRNETAKAEMQKEIAEIEAEAERRIAETKKRYAVSYGQKEWNTSADDALREFVRKTMDK